jgi:hypothetical protein
MFRLVWTRNALCDLVISKLIDEKAKLRAFVVDFLNENKIYKLLWTYSVCLIEFVDDFFKRLKRRSTSFSYATHI